MLRRLGIGSWICRTQGFRGIQITITSSGATCKKFMDLKSCLYIFLWVFYWRFDFCEGLAHLNRNGQGHSLTNAQWQGQRGVLRWGVCPRFSGVASLLWIFTNLKAQSFQFLICWTSSWESWELPKKCVCWGGQQVGLLIWLHRWVSLCLYSTISRSTMFARSCVCSSLHSGLSCSLCLSVQLIQC